MFKKVEIWILYLLILFFCFILVIFGSLVRHKLMGGNSLPLFSKPALFIAEIPFNIKNLFFVDPLEVHPTDFKDFKDKSGFVGSPSKDNNLLLLSRYDGNIRQSVVELIDLNNFEILHTWNPDINFINSKTSKFKIKKDISWTLDLEKDKNENRYRIYNPLVLKNGSLIFADWSPLIKIDVCGNYIWHNDEDLFHHLINIDHNYDYWVASEIYPSEINQLHNLSEENHYWDDAITKISKYGKILYQKSVTEIFIENNMEHLLFSVGIHYEYDPIHLNDIQPALEDTKFWKKGDLFLSINNQAMIMQFRPSTNEIINIITGPFSHQHDVDIISDHEISIFNNKVFNTYKAKNNEIVIYNFKTNNFSKKFDNSIKELNFFTDGQGLSELDMKNGNMLIEETETGRLIYLNKNGDLLWEYINKAKNKKMFTLNMSSLITNKNDIDHIKKSINEAKCLN